MAHDFGVNPMTLNRWLRQERIDSGEQAGMSSTESDELRELRCRNRVLEQEIEVLRRADAYLSQAHLPGKGSPAREQAGRRRDPRGGDVPGVEAARQPFYRWLSLPVTDAEWVEAHRANVLFDAHHDDPEFGYRFLVDEVRDADQPMADRTSWRICRENQWWSVFGKPSRGKHKRPGPLVQDGLVERQFHAEEPNQVWLTDISEHRTAEGKIYLCAVKDVFSGRIVGYSIDSRMKARLAVAALDNAVARRRIEGQSVAGCVLHSDRGS